MRTSASSWCETAATWTTGAPGVAGGMEATAAGLRVAGLVGGSVRKSAATALTRVRAGAGWVVSEDVVEASVTMVVGAASSAGVAGGVDAA